MTKLIPSPATEMMGLDDRGNKLAVGLMIGGGLALIAGVITFFWRRQSGLGRVTVVSPPVHQGGMTLTHYRDKKLPIEDRLKILQDLTWQSVQDPRNRKLALGLTKHCADRDEECERRAIYDGIKKNIRYTGDVAAVAHGAGGVVEGVDLFQSAYRTWEFGGGDCLPLSTLVLRDDYMTVPLAALNPGDRIMADGAWTTVEDRWLTGMKSLLAFKLSNGCVLPCTPEHHIFRVVKGRVEEIRAEEARVGDDLAVVDAIPVPGTEIAWPEPFNKLDAADKAWLLGVYIADGWHETHVREGVVRPYRIAVSGKDGHPKEEQKRRICELIEPLGIHVEWDERFVRINHTALAQFLSKAGCHAPEKHVPTMAFRTTEEVQALLDGLAADAAQEGRDHAYRVHGTTSAELALQLRILYRMIGKSVHIRRVDEHGGLGQNPIYRITVRDNPQRQDIRFARICAIQDGGIEACCDVTTEAGKFWLPESDTLVHNCDDHSILAATLLSLNGIPAKFRVTANRKGEDFSHIYTMAGAPKMNPTKWVAIDTTLPGDRFGYEVPFAKKQDFAA